MEGLRSFLSGVEKGVLSLGCHLLGGCLLQHLLPVLEVHSFLLLLLVGLKNLEKGVLLVDSFLSQVFLLEI